MNENPYIQCPVYETQHFTFRLVQEADAQDLLACYSDPEAARFFNSDNCTSDFHYQTLEEMRSCIQGWLSEYEHQGFIRFAIVEKAGGTAAGTIECFAKPEPFPGFGMAGILRLDLVSRLERGGVITEILEMVNDHLYDCFEVQSMVTKAVPTAKERVRALRHFNYQEMTSRVIMPFDDYYVRVR